jgi:autotransporter-associated beta strand protein
MAGAAGAVLTVNNANTYNGVTTISSGTLQVNNASALGSTTGGTVVASGASLAISNGITLAGEPITLNGNGTANNNGALRTVDPLNPVTVAAPITLGNNARIAAGPSGSQLVVTAPITDNGSNYTLFVQVPSANSSVLLNSAGNMAGNLQVFGSTVKFGVNNTFPSASLTVGAGLFDLNGTTQTFAGLQPGSTPTNGVVTNSLAALATLDINYSGSNAAQLQSAIAGPINVVKEGAGLQSFIGGAGIVHTYTGTTTINGGILGLAADVSQVTNNWIVNAGGTLRGTSTIGGAVTVNAGGTIYAGYASNAVGTLTINNSLSLNGNTIVALNKDQAQSNDVINVSGAISYGGTLTIYNLGTNALVAGDSFTVFSPGGTGSFSSIIGDPGVTYSFNANTGVLTVASVAPPTAPTLGYTALGAGVLQFNWTGAYKLQWQTNALNQGLSSNWVDYPGGGASPVNVTNNPTVPAAFFRLAPQ